MTNNQLHPRLPSFTDDLTRDQAVAMLNAVYRHNRIPGFWATLRQFRKDNNLPVSQQD